MITLAAAAICTPTSILASAGSQSHGAKLVSQSSSGCGIHRIDSVETAASSGTTSWTSSANQRRRATRPSNIRSHGQVNARSIAMASSQPPRATRHPVSVPFCVVTSGRNAVTSSSRAAIRRSACETTCKQGKWDMDDCRQPFDRETNICGNDCTEQQLSLRSDVE